MINEVYYKINYFILQLINFYLCSTCLYIYLNYIYQLFLLNINVNILNNYN
jgi:hypothetical protein